MALIPLTNDAGDVGLAYDSETFLLQIVKRGALGEYEVVGPAVQTVKPDFDLAAELLDAPVAAGAAGTAEVLASPGPNKAIWVYGWVLGFGATGTYQWLSALRPLTGSIDVAAIGLNDGVAPVTGYPYLKCGPNEALNITTVGAGATVEGFIVYRIVGA